MSLASQIAALASRVATEFNTVRDEAPPRATQSQVNARTATGSYVSPATLAGWEATELSIPPVSGITGTIHLRRWGPLVHVHGALSGFSLASGTFLILGSVPNDYAPPLHARPGAARFGADFSGVVSVTAGGNIETRQRSGSTQTSMQFEVSYFIF